MLVRLACLPLPFICLPLLFICLPVLFRVGFCGAGLSPTSCHLSPTLSPTSYHLSPRLFSFVSQAGCLWSGSRLACLPLPFICLPLLFICPAGSCGWVCGWLVSHVLSFVSHFFHLSPSSFHLSPSSFHFWSPRLGACGRVPWLVSHLSPTSFHLSPFLSFVGFPAGLSPTSFPTSFHLSPSSFHCLWCLWSRVCGWLVSHFLSFVSHFLSFVSHFFSFPKQFTVRGSQCFKEWSPWCWMVWSGSRPPCLPLPFICLPLLFICLPSSVLVVGFAAGLSPTSFHLSPTSFHLSPSSFHLSPRLGACGRVPGWLVSHFLSFGFPLPFICLPLLFICLPLLFICLPVLFICLPGWVSPLQWTKPTRQERCLMAYFAVLAFCLPSDFHNIGPRACENCKQLVEVNLMCTEVTALHKSTFAQCVAMTDIWLPPRLTQIGKEVFLNCIALREVVVPTELQRYRSSGFLWV